MTNQMTIGVICILLVTVFIQLIAGRRCKKRAKGWLTQYKHTMYAQMELHQRAARMRQALLAVGSIDLQSVANRRVKLEEITALCRRVGSTA